MVEYSFSLVTFEYFLLILIRISSFIFAAPFFGMTNVPARVKISMACFISIIVFTFKPESLVEYAGIFSYTLLVLKEGITGLLIGFAANICNSIILFAGTMIDTHLGLSMAMEYDPVSRAQVSISSNFYQYVLLLLLVVSDMHHYILRALVDSFELIPVGGSVFQWNYLMTGMVNFVGDLFSIGFRITLPVFACIMILNAVLGIMAKLSPQMNMFAIGMQLKIIVGLFILLFTIFLLPMVADYIFTEMKVMIVYMIKGMYAGE
ncbi:MAG: flagellar biosynthetic protein FliR [Lachnospiraceae bacterium]|nr:flagellar biosynthetic protein FliR [Lachnospiraceae bacterium]